MTDLIVVACIGPDDDAFLVMACDGLWDVMTNQEVVDFVVSRLDLLARPDRTEEVSYKLSLVCRCKIMQQLM